MAEDYLINEQDVDDEELEDLNIVDPDELDTEAIDYDEVLNNMNQKELNINLNYLACLSGKVCWITGASAGIGKSLFFCFSL